MFKKTNILCSYCVTLLGENPRESTLFIIAIDSDFDSLEQRLFDTINFFNPSFECKYTTKIFNHSFNKQSSHALQNDSHEIVAKTISRCHNFTSCT